jgi:hypothetical protein
MLAEPKDIEPDLVGQFDLLDQVLEPLGRLRTFAPARIGVHVGKGIKAQFHGLHPVEFIPSDKDGAEREQIQILEGIVREC